MAMGEGAANGDGLVEAGEGDAALERMAWMAGSLERLAMTDVGALAPGLAEQDGRGAVAIGDGLDVEAGGRHDTWKQNIAEMIL